MSPIFCSPAATRGAAGLRCGCRSAPAGRRWCASSGGTPCPGPFPPPCSVAGVAFVSLEFPRTYGRTDRVSVTQEVRRELDRLAGAGRLAAASDLPSVGGRAGITTYFERGGDPSKRLATAARIHASAAY